MANSYVNFMKQNKNLVLKLINIIKPMEDKITYRVDKCKQ